MEKIINAGVDWLTMTYPYQEDHYQEDQYQISHLNFLLPCLEYLLQVDSENCDHRISKRNIDYKYMNVYDDGTSIKYGGDNVKKEILIAADEYQEAITKTYNSLCLNLSGSGCRRCDELDIPVLDLLDTRKKFKGECTRLDLFVDFINYDLNMIDFIDKVKKLEFTTYFKKCSFRSDYSFGSNLYINGESLTFGSRNSNIELCIYNKKLERENNDYAVEVQDWIRFEIRFRFLKAEPAAAEYSNILLNKENIIDYVSSLINAVLELKEPSSDSNKSRWQTWGLWKELFSKKGVIPKNQSKLESRFTKKIKWFQNSVYRNYTLNFLYCKYGGQDEFFKDVLRKGLEKFQYKDLEKLNNELKRNGFEGKLTKDDLTALLLKINEELAAGKSKSGTDSDLPF